MKITKETFNTFNKYTRLTLSILDIFRTHNICEYTIMTISAKYVSDKKEIIMHFRNTRRKYVCTFIIKNRDDYEVMLAILSYMNLLNKVEVISNVSKTKRQRSR